MLRNALLAAPFLFLSAIPNPSFAAGVINVATIGEPPTLDPMASTADVVGMTTQHIFETLFTFDAEWNVVPLLAEAMPTVSADGQTYDITLRKGIKFHDGSTMTSADVVASVERWVKIASRGKQIAPYFTSITAKGDDAVQIVLSKPYAPLLSLLAFNNSAAVIMPKANLADDPLTKFIGTGPYLLKERKADQYLQLTRFDGYQPRSEAANGFGGARKAILDEIRFVPVPDANTRLEGAISGQFDYADSLAPETFDRLKGSDASEPVVLKPYGAPVFVMNTKEGVLAKKEMRHAIQAALNPEDMLLAAFGNPEFFAVNGALYPEGYVWHTEEGIERYGNGDPETAASMAKEAGYDGEKPIRILTSRQYEFHYKMAQVAAEYLKAAGFKVELGVFDWATLTTRRADPKLWDIFITHGPFPPEPILNGWMSDSYPGWWATPAKTAAVEPFIAEPDQEKRKALWAEIQKTFYEEAPVYKVGDFNALGSKKKTLKDFQPSPWPYFWNVSTAN
ncbi:ABC transporter substrate-binding protein [Rhizobiales bacterium RZME27]|uniref:ABC transporter substrate-binding protein n=1 Tax=Endobacterium cereale TaxID=2663029 RepID=A0A6A8AC28_9HYPH|nr:ABC transporter substrate-binding protein [Endobacterium cereale]MEB2846098.1 ABC transporter substrate-binding protein [Endobacterium cereale]MQY48309.1 ABC transporter substrate-binding protein [Endobacterium cereale]